MAMTSSPVISTDRVVQRPRVGPRPDLWRQVRLATSLAALLLIVYLIDLAPLSFVAASASLGLAGWWLAAVAFRPRQLLDQLLLAWTVAVALLGGLAEVLSALTLMGLPEAWLLGATAIALAST